MRKEIDGLGIYLCKWGALELKFWGLVEREGFEMDMLKGWVWGYVDGTVFPVKAKEERFGQNGKTEKRELISGETCCC